MSLAVSYPSLSTTIIKSELETNFSDITGKFGSIDNSDVAANAAISVSKLSASYEHIVVPITVPLLAGGWNFAADVLVAAVPLPGVGESSNWTPKYVEWICTDTGAGACQFMVYWGTINAAGALVHISGAGAATAILSGNIVLTNRAAAEDTNFGTKSVTGSAIAYNNANQGFLAIVSKAPGVDASTISAGFLTVSVYLSRQISST